MLRHVGRFTAFGRANDAGFEELGPIRNLNDGIAGRVETGVDAEDAGMRSMHGMLAGSAGMFGI